MPQRRGSGTECAQRRGQAAAHGSGSASAQDRRPAPKGDRLAIGGHASALSEEPAPLALRGGAAQADAADSAIRRPRFWSPGNIAPGITLPTGAVWQPALWVFGDFRTTAGYFDNGIAPRREYWSNQLNLFFNLKLSPTERILLGFSPLSDGAEQHRHPARLRLRHRIRRRTEPDPHDILRRGRIRRDFPRPRSERQQEPSTSASPSGGSRSSSRTA